MSEQFTLVTGRTRKQAVGMHKGKGSPEYRLATAIVEMNSDDMARLGIADGGLARLGTPDGDVELTAHSAELPSGLVFVPMGTSINALISSATQGTGMPSFKGLKVDVMPVAPEGGPS